MKNYKTLALCILISMGGLSALQAEEDGWMLYHRTSDGGTLYYEQKSILVEENVTEVWSKFVPAVQSDIREMKNHVRFDCSRGKLKILNSNTYYRNGSLIELTHNNSFEPVEPGSSSEALFKSVCSRHEE